MDVWLLIILLKSDPDNIKFSPFMTQQECVSARSNLKKEMRNNKDVFDIICEPGRIEKNKIKQDDEWL